MIVGHRDERRAARLPRAHRDLPRPRFRLRAVVGRSTDLRPDHLVRRRGAGEVTTHFRVDWSGRRRRPVDRPVRRTDLAGDVVGWHLPAVHARVRARRAAGGHRADRREHRPRQGRRRDDRRPTSTRCMGRAIAADGIGTVIADDRRWLADHDLRREHRRHGRDPGLLHRGLRRRRGRRDPRSASARSSARSSRPPRAACSAGSPSCSTA